MMHFHVCERSTIVGIVLQFKYKVSNANRIIQVYEKVTICLEIRGSDMKFMIVGGK